MRQMAQPPFALLMRGFRWQLQQGVWQRAHLALSDDEIDTVPEPCWQGFVQHRDEPGCPSCERPWEAGLS